MPRAAGVATVKLASLLPAAALFAACAVPLALPADGNEAHPRVTGTIAWRERIALSPAALVRVQLVDVSRADAPATVLGEQIITPGGRSPPYAFEIRFDPARIEANHAYAVQARVEDDGKLRFINDRRYPVLTRDAPAHVELLLTMVGRPD